MSREDLLWLRSVVANVNVALDVLESRSEIYFELQSPANKGWLTRAERNLYDVLWETQARLLSRPDLWENARLTGLSSLEEASEGLTTILDMFPEVDPGMIEDGDEPLTLPEDEHLVQEETATLTRAAISYISRAMRA